MSKWRENGEMERYLFSTFSLYFLPLYPFPISKLVSFCRKMLNTALMSRMSQKKLHRRCEKIILGRIHCEKVTQVVTAWHALHFIRPNGEIIMTLHFN